MELKDFKKVFFGRDQEYNQISDSIKNKHRFMINRMMATRYPLHANLVNLIGTDGSVIVDIWRQFCKEQNINFIQYVPTKKSMFTKEFSWYPKEKEMLKRYCDHFSISIREFEERLRWEPNKTRNEFIEYEKIFK